MNCVKTKYSTKEFALSDIERIRKISKRSKVPCSAYICKCGSWHLTSSKPRTEIISELEKEIIEKDKIIFDLKEELSSLKQQINVLKSEDRIKIRTDKTLKELHDKNLKLNKIVKKKNEDEVVLIMKNIQLEKQIETIKNNNND